MLVDLTMSGEVNSQERKFDLFNNNFNSLLANCDFDSIESLLSLRKYDN
jgi:hypothetical protein